jgi:hypothetical protein
MITHNTITNNAYTQYYYQHTHIYFNLNTKIQHNYRVHTLKSITANVSYYDALQFKNMVYPTLMTTLFKMHKLFT